MKELNYWLVLILVVVIWFSVSNYTYCSQWTPQELLNIGVCDTFILTLP